MDSAGNHGRGKVMRAHDHVGDDFRVLGILDAGFEHADDSADAIADTAEANGFADDGRIFSEHCRPEAVGEHDHAASLRAVVLRIDQTAEDRVKAHHVEIRSANHPATHLARLTKADHGEPHFREVAEL